MDKYTSSQPLLPHSSLPERSSSKKSLALLLSLFALLALLVPSPLNPLNASLSSWTASPATLKNTCGQAEAIIPDVGVHDIASVWKEKDRIISWHQGAIRVPTQVYDEMGEPGEDHRWDIFQELHDSADDTRSHKNLKRTKVDTYGLIYEWFGSDDSLQPLFLTAHQDVVPVLQDTVYQWKQDPFNGTYDGTYIWGRGSNDDKSGLTAIMSAIELLLQSSDFKPTRTVILGFGHDEERGGQRGAPAIRDWLLENYGPDSMSLLVDEGSGISTTWGRSFGLPAVAEKGKFNLNMTVSTLGGHSSIPPKHTNIGMTSLLVAALEKNPHPVILEEESPIWGFLQCAANYAPDMPKGLKKSVGKAQGSKKAFEELPEEVIDVGLGGDWATPGMGDMTEALLTTTQAADIIYGGVKVNALPEVVTVIVNHRINIASTPSDVISHIFNTILPVAKDLGLGISGLGQSYTPKGTLRGHIILGDAFEPAHEPAPISPTDLGTAAWRVLAGTSRGVWASRPEVSKDGKMVDLPEKEELIMAPYMGTGNTDTRRYWDLTRNIYRWRYFPDAANQGAHTINERVSADAMVEFARFYQALILNVDASRDM
ncbi:hypothetical protein JCM24511_03027 [Saitozyma sp. JCM 24511]|nr:hypothetical protein JCM24511_03027 [Saitozyma sp. JCM 24511]